MPGASGSSASVVSMWRDLLLAAGLTLLVAVLAASVELHERVYDFTRRWEWLQLDEWPSALLFFACCMVVLYARRHVQLRHALGENRRLVGRIIEVQEQERHRLARELHDELGQYLNAIKLDAQALTIGTDAAATEACARRIAASADHVYGVAGNLVRRLRPPALDELGLVAALEACVDTWRRSHPALLVQLSTGGRLDDLGEQVNLAVYRIVQEALTNCVRHAHASRMFIDLTRTPDAGGGLLLEIRDDGVGAPAGVRGGGGGLTGMRERTVVLGGSFAVLSEAGQGVTIHVEIPLDAGKS
jgi:two-component system sensor histidine kinase UhpB